MEKKRSIHKIAYVIDDLGYGGAQTLLAHLVQALPPKFTPQVYCLSENTSPHAEAMRNGGTDVFAFKRRTHVDVGRLIAFARLLARERSSLIHSFLYSSNAYSYIAGRLLRIPVILSLQSSQLRFGKVKNGLLRFMFRHADRVTVNSKAGETFLLDSVKVPARKVLRVRNWIPPAMLHDTDYPENSTPGGGGDAEHPRTGDAPKESNDIIVGYVGRLVPGKQVDVLMKAFAHASSSHPGARLQLIGDGPERGALEALTRELNLEHRVEFLGRVPDLRPLMKRFRCLVLPSAFEGLPNVILEALAMGIPVVATPVGDIADLIRDGHNGRIVDGNSPEALSSALADTIDDEALSMRTRIEGPRLIASDFSVPAALDALLPMYHELVSNELKVQRA